MLTHKILLFYKNHPYIFGSLFLLIFFLIFSMLIDEDSYIKFSDNYISSYGIFIMIDTLVSVFISINSWQKTDDKQYYFEQNAFLKLKFLAFLMLFISVFLVNTEMLEYKNMFSIIFYSLSYSVIFSSIAYSFSLFMGILINKE